MFDNPKDDLQRLEQALREEEAQELAPDAEDLDLDAILEEFGSEEQPKRKRKNPAANFHRTVYDDEVFDEDAAVPDYDPKPKGIGGLLVLAILELAGIVTVALLWAKWLL